MNRTIPLAGALLALFAVSASATDHTVIARPGRTFDPPSLDIAVGDTVTFMNDTTTPGFHNVKSDTGAIMDFRCANGCDGDGAGGNGDPSSTLWSATVTFPTAGSIAYHCEIHGGDGGVGMSGVINVGLPTIGVDQTSLGGFAEEGGTTSIPFSVSNTGLGDLVWNADTATTDCTAPDAVPWIGIDPAGGTIVPGDPPTDVTVTLDATSLTAGIYNANVCVHSNDAANDPIAIPVEFTVSIPDAIFASGFDP